MQCKCCGASDPKYHGPKFRGNELCAKCYIHKLRNDLSFEELYRTHRHLNGESNMMLEIYYGDNFTFIPIKADETIKIQFRQF